MTWCLPSASASREGVLASQHAPGIASRGIWLAFVKPLSCLTNFCEREDRIPSPYKPYSNALFSSQINWVVIPPGWESTVPTHVEALSRARKWLIKE